MPNSAATALLVAVLFTYNKYLPNQIFNFHNGLNRTEIWNPACPLSAGLEHYCDVIIISAMASQITNLTIVYPTVYSGTDQRKHQSSTSLPFVGRIQRWLVNSPHKGPVTRKMFPFDDVIIEPQISYAYILVILCAILTESVPKRKLNRLIIWTTLLKIIILGFSMFTLVFHFLV